MGEPVAEGESVAEQLAALFSRNGYVRHQNAQRKATEGHRRYKKGTEVRLTANSEAELERIRGLLQTAGFRLARPYRHGATQFRQPLYGRPQVERFL